MGSVGFIELNESVALKSRVRRADLELIELLIYQHDELLRFFVDAMVRSTRSVRLTSSRIVKPIVQNSEDTTELFLPVIYTLISDNNHWIAYRYNYCAVSSDLSRCATIGSARRFRSPNLTATCGVIR